MIRRTATANAPWYVVPSDQKWFTRLVVASIIAKTLEELKLAYPRVDQTKKQDLARAKKSVARRTFAKIGRRFLTGPTARRILRLSCN
jgi:hypothetical protein